MSFPFSRESADEFIRRKDLNCIISQVCGCGDQVYEVADIAARDAIASPSEGDVAVIADADGSGNQGVSFYNGTAWTDPVIEGGGGADGNGIYTPANEALIVSSNYNVKLTDSLYFTDNVGADFLRFGIGGAPTTSHTLQVFGDQRIFKDQTLVSTPLLQVQLDTANPTNQEQGQVAIVQNLMPSGSDLVYSVSRSGALRSSFGFHYNTAGSYGFLMAVSGSNANDRKKVVQFDVNSNVELLGTDVPVRSFGSVTPGAGVLRLNSVITPPSGTLTSGGLLYVSGNSLFYYDTTGTATDLTVGGGGTWLKPELEAGSAVTINAVGNPALSIQDLGNFSTTAYPRTNFYTEHTATSNYVDIVAFPDVATTMFLAEAYVHNTTGGAAARGGGYTINNLGHEWYTYPNYIRKLMLNPTGEFGIGGPVPVVDLHVSAEGTAPSAALYDANDTALLTNNISTVLRQVSSSSTATVVSTISLGRTRGTISTPTIVQSGDSIGQISFQGYDGTARRSAASMLVEVDGTPGASDMPGRIIFNTTPDGSATPVERMRINNAGQVGVNTTAPATLLHVSADGNIPNALLYNASGDQLIISSGTASGQAGFRVLTAENTTAGLGSAVVFMRSRGTLASPTIVQNGDRLGAFSAQGYDGTNRRTAAQIVFDVDGVPGASDMPGRISLLTTADGSIVPTERMRIDNAGVFRFDSSGSNPVNVSTSGTGTFNIGNYPFNSDQTVGAGQNKFALIYNGTEIELQSRAAPITNEAITAAHTLNWQSNPNHVYELDCTGQTASTFTLSNPVTGGVYTVRLYNVTTMAITWPGTVLDETGTAFGTTNHNNGVMYTFYFNGTNYYAKSI